VRRRDKWWHREIEKIRRENAAREADLIATICRLAGKPAPTGLPEHDHDDDAADGDPPQHVHPDFLAD
jgi:hypothetical protein